MILVKPGIHRLAINRSKEINKQKNSILNCLLMKQVFFTKELQAGHLARFHQLTETKARIVEWYENESRKVVLQTRVDDVQESEKVRIYHHEQHKKSIKKTSILKLQTYEGLLVGHEACSSFLESQLANLLLHPDNLEPTA